jgi:7-cyano-7-deazaguanine synthase in queuosine biosynthesis
MYGQAKPAGLLSVDAYVEVIALDVRNWFMLAITLAVATQSLKWTVYGANEADYSDETVAQAEATVVAAAVGTFTIVNPPFAYYRAKIKAAVGGVQGTGTARAIYKRPD